MALPTTSHFELRSSATTGNVNGAGFNIANANFPTDLTTDSNTANTASPVCSSATYTFVAGDVGAWLYVASGTNFIVGWYQIASVAAGKATLTATIGSAVVFNSTLETYGPSTVAGIATTGTPTGGTFGIDYSQQDAAEATATDYAATGSSTTLTSATGGFTRMMVGNYYHQTTTGTGAFGVVGWYEIVSYTNATTVVLDRTPNNGTASVACIGYVGGAGSFNALEDAFFEMIPASSYVWFKSGTYTTSAAMSVGSSAGTATATQRITGYTALRGDTCNGTDRPIWALGANNTTMGTGFSVRNMSFSGTNATGISSNSHNSFINCKFHNSSTTANRPATNAGAETIYYECEFISQNGNGVIGSTITRLIGCYFHDTQTAVNPQSIGTTILGCVFASNDIAAVTASSTGASGNYISNTFYGRESKIGIGLNLNTAGNPRNIISNNIFYGLTTAVEVLTTNAKSNISRGNNYYNNTTDVTLLTKDLTDTALDPQFVGASQISGTTATTSASVLTQSGGDFSTVTDSVDFLHVLSGTGVTTGIYLITGHTGTTLTTNNALGTSSAGDVVYYISVGHNFSVGANMKQVGYPRMTNNGLESTTSYIDVGAIQAVESGGGGGSGGSFTFS